jgi:nitronate monooxygenase
VAAGDRQAGHCEALAAVGGHRIDRRFLDRYSAAAPVAYPELHRLTAPLRQAGRAAGDPGLVNLWAGQTYELGRQLPAGQLVRALAEEARAASSRHANG